MSSPLPLPAFSPLQARVILFILSALCYACSWDGDFVFDDSAAIIGNKDLDPERPLSDLLIHDFWGNKLSNTSHKSYRPLTVLTFRWNYWLSGGLHPPGFHIANIFLHTLISILLMDFFHLVFHTPSQGLQSHEPPTPHVTKNGHGRPGAGHHGGQCRAQCRADAISFLCALLFAVHPVHSESVAGIVGRADLLCAVFFISSFLVYVKGCTQEQATRPSSFSLPHILLSTVLCGLATFSKEQGITVIGVCCAYDILSICQVDLGDLFGLRSSGSQDSSSSSSSSSSSLSSSSSSPAGNGCHGASSKHLTPPAYTPWVMSLAKRVLCLSASALVLLTLRWRIMGSSPPTFQVHDNPHSFVNGTLYRTLNYHYVYVLNAWLVLCPHWLCFDWSMGCVPTITSLTDPRIGAVLVFWGLLALLAWACLRGLHRDTARPVVLGVVLTVVPFLPATNLFFRVGFVVAERVLYLPSAGVCVLVCLGMRGLGHRWPQHAQRSLHWKTEMALFKAGEKVCPLNAKIHYNIGKLNGDIGNTDIAILRYRHAIQLNPVYDQAMNNLANILKDQGHLEESESLLDKAVEINPKFSSGWMNRGITKAGLRKFQESEESYWNAISIRRNYPDCYYNLGNMLLETERHQEALDAFRNATLLKPTHFNAWNNAVILLDSNGHHDQAIKLGLQALKHLPDHPSILYSLGNAYGKTSDYSNSERMFLGALRVDAKNAALLHNLGVLYHRWGKKDKALEFYERAYEIHPGNPGLVDNINMLKRQMGQGK